MHIKSVVRLIASLMLILGLLVAGPLSFTPSAAGPRLDRLTILGGPPGGVFGIFATGIGTFLSRAVPNLDVSVAATGGSVENVRRVNAGDAEMGIAFTSDVHESYYGLEGFKGNPHTNLRTIGMIFLGIAHVVTFRDSGIRTVEDLVGKRVAVGTPGSGTFATAERIFRSLGIWDRITRVPLLGAAAGSAMGDGRVDAYFWTGPFPDRVTIEAAVTRPVHFIDAYTPLLRTDFMKVFPYYARYIIPAGSYAGVTENTPALGVPALWFVHKDVPAPLVQRMVEAAYGREGHGHMLRVHSASSDMTSLKALQGVTIPLHRGAEAYWVTRNIEIPERIRAR